MLTLCVALFLYNGPIEHGTPVTEIAMSCKDVKIAAARAPIAKCAKQGAEKCEVILSADKKRVTLENKVQATPKDK